MVARRGRRRSSAAPLPIAASPRQGAEFSHRAHHFKDDLERVGDLRRQRRGGCRAVQPRALNSALSRHRRRRRGTSGATRATVARIASSCAAKPISQRLSAIRRPRTSRPAAARAALPTSTCCSRPGVPTKIVGVLAQRLALLLHRVAAQSSAKRSAAVSVETPVPQKMPKTGIKRPPHFSAAVSHQVRSSEGEPLYERRPQLVPDMLLRDAERLAKPDSVRNRVVYDSIEPNPIKAKVSPTGKSLPRPGTNDKPGVVELDPYYVLKDQSDSTLVFESRFESGNLRRAIQVYDNEYDLIIKPDINTRGHTQWFYFRVKNTRKKTKYKFNMINLYKADSLYNRGMQSLIYSMMDAKEQNVGWVRRGRRVLLPEPHQAAGRVLLHGNIYCGVSLTPTTPCTWRIVSHTRTQTSSGTCWRSRRIRNAGTGSGGGHCARPSLGTTAIF